MWNLKNKNRRDLKHKPCFHTAGKLKKGYIQGHLKSRQGLIEYYSLQGNIQKETQREKGI